MARRPTKPPLSSSSAAQDVNKSQAPSPRVMQYIRQPPLCPVCGGATACDEIGLPVSATGGVVPCGATALWQEG